MGTDIIVITKHNNEITPKIQTRISSDNDYLEVDINKDDYVEQKTIQKLINWIDRFVDIDLFRAEIDVLKNSSGLNNFEIASQFIENCFENNSDSAKDNLAINIVSKIKSVKAIIKVGTNIWNTTNQIADYLRCIAGISITYDTNISKPVNLLIPVLKTFSNSFPATRAAELSLAENDLNRFISKAPDIAKNIVEKLLTDKITDVCGTLAGALPIVGGTIERNIKSNSEKNSLLSQDNIYKLIESYEELYPSGSDIIFPIAHKQVVNSSIAKHFIGLFSNKLFMIFLGFCTWFLPLFPIFFPIWVIGIIVNQKYHQRWLWYDDKFFVGILMLTLCWPVALYGAYKGQHFYYGQKWYDNRAFLIFSLIFLAPFIVTTPFAMYISLRTNAISKFTKVLLITIMAFYLGLIVFSIIHKA